MRPPGWVRNFGVTAFIQTLLDDASAAAARVTLGAASLIGWQPSGFPTRTGASTGTITAIVVEEDFLHPDAFRLVKLSNSGANSGLSRETGGSGRIGVAVLTTGTEATGRAAFLSDPQMLRFGGGRHRVRWDVRIPNASTGGETFHARVGFMDEDDAEPVDGAFFRYTHGTNGGEWEAVTRANDVETATAFDTNVALDTGNIVSFEIEVNAAGTSATFYINGTLVATSAANIPTGSGRETGVGASIIKSVGTTARTLRADMVRYSFEPTSPT